MSARRPIGRWLAFDAAPLAACMAVIWWLSDQPDLPHAPDAVLDFVAKKVLHAAGYGVLAWLWQRALRGRAVPGATRWALALAVGHAVLDEWHQTFVPGRMGRPADVLIDAAGAATALGVLAARARRQRRCRQREV